MKNVIADVLSWLDPPETEEFHIYKANNAEIALAGGDEEFSPSLEILSKNQQEDRETRNLIRETGFHKKKVDTVPIIYTDKDRIVISPFL